MDTICTTAFWTNPILQFYRKKSLNIQWWRLVYIKLIFNGTGTVLSYSSHSDWLTLPSSVDYIKLHLSLQWAVRFKIGSWLYNTTRLILVDCYYTDIFLYVSRPMYMWENNTLCNYSVVFNEMHLTLCLTHCACARVDLFSVNVLLCAPARWVW